MPAPKAAIHAAGSAGLIAPGAGAAGATPPKAAIHWLIIPETSGSALIAAIWSRHKSWNRRARSSSSAASPPFSPSSVFAMAAEYSAGRVGRPVAKRLGVAAPRL